MTPPPVVWFVVPKGIDDPARVSGGNVYDREVRDGLRDRGWTVSIVECADAAGVASALRSASDGTLVLIDGLAAGWAAPEVEAATGRLRIVVLAHMLVAAFPDATASEIEAETRMLRHAHRVIVTGRWTGEEVARRGLADAERITVARPGVRAADVPEPEHDAALLCVGVVAPHKGQDLLLDALDRVPTNDWRCTIAGSTDSYRGFAERIAQRAAAFDGRVRLPGVLVGEALADAYRRSAVLVAPSRVESAGMAIADARARGIPVVGTAVGGIPDTVLGGGAILVRPDDPDALAHALTSWMTDPALRERLRAEALRAREHLPTWDDTVATIADALEAA